jgi:CheY-like chemotaxis protein
MEKRRILWVDDEIEILKPHIIFLNQKGYDVITATNGSDALDIIKEQRLDIVFLDENMPGMSGIEVLPKVKNLRPALPVVMITKNEEESIMEDAIGSKIDDYLIKPVNPNQILLCLKKNLEERKLLDQKTTMDYQREFRQIGMDISAKMDYNEWVEIYKRMVYWEVNLQNSSDEGIKSILSMQKEEANTVFAKYYIDHYKDWIHPDSKEKPLFSHTLLRNKLFPVVEEHQTTFLIVIDNLRYDQWKILQPEIEQHFYVEKDEIFYSIIPTVTQYSRNAMFSGMMPSEIQKRYPNLWVEDEDEYSKNYFEKDLLAEHLKRLGKNYKFSFHKILNLQAGKKLAEQMSNLLSNKLNVIIYNFVDMISHARTEMDIIKELADDEAAYRTLTLSWYIHSPLYDIMKFLSEKNIPVLLTTDHGSVQIKNPVKIIGDRETNTNIRFKYGRNLNYESKNLFEVSNPTELYLPRPNVSTSYVFCKGYDYLVYPNNYNQFVRYFNNTFQHGGISMEEILAPVILLKQK